MRIITGSARGTRLKSPVGEGTRPTADRTREALFSMLGARVYDARVLDLFAGTGALALEALSRGAAHAVLVDRATHTVLQENVRRTKMEERAEIRRGDVYGQTAALSREGRRFDLIFADPPYALPELSKLPELVTNGYLLSEGGIFVLEHPKTFDFSAHPCFSRQRVYGSVHFSFFIREEARTDA